MEKWKVEVLTFYAIIGFFLNFMFHHLFDIHMWTMDYGVGMLMPVAIIIDSILSWIRILELANELGSITLSITVLILLPFLFVVTGLIGGVLSTILNRQTRKI